MARPHACRSLCWNPPPISKDEFAGAALGLIHTNDSRTPTYIFFVLRVFIPVLAPFPAPANSTARYFEKDL